MLTHPFYRRLLPVLVLLSSVLLILASKGSELQAAEPTYEGNAPLMIMTIDGKDLRQFTRVPGLENYGSPLWSHDGTKVAFDAYADNSFSNHVFIVEADGSSPHDVHDGAMPSWAPDDKRLVFHRYNQNWGLWVIQADGTGLERLTTRGNSARWSPDGVQIAHLGSEPGSFLGELGIMVYSTLEGTDESLLPTSALEPRFRVPIAGFQWSPDGRRLGFTAARSDGGQGLFIYTLEGPQQGLKLRLEAEQDHLGMGVAWSADSKEALIALQTEADHMPQIYRIEIDTDAAPVRLPGQDPDRAATDLAWSPDGKWVVFCSSPTP